MTTQRIGSVSDVPEGKSKLYKVNGQPIAVFHVNGKWFAFNDQCTHRGFPLNGASIDGTTITCNYHGAQFDLTTGKNIGPPAPAPVQTYKISAEGNDLYLDV